MTSPRRKRVVVVSKSVMHYRSRFFDLARAALDRSGVELELIQGQPLDPREQSDAVAVPWAERVPSRVIALGGRRLLWQPVLARTRGADLVVLEQASKLLVNYVLIARAHFGGARVALWGHGRTLEGGKASRAGEWIKRACSTRVHWWFAYNDVSAQIVERLGFPRERITSLQNTIDTVELRAARAQLTEDDLSSLRRELGIRGGHTCVFVGGMYAAKRVRFLLDACRRIRQQVPDFEMIFVGGGPDADVVVEAARREPWIKYVGPQYGVDRVKFFALARLQLLPGAVGLGIVDSITLGVPLVTTDARSHGPEISYLEHGRNGVMVEGSADPTTYGDVVANLLRDEAAISKLVAGCGHSQGVYSLESMVDRFVAGVQRALQPRAGQRTQMVSARPSNPSGCESSPTPSDPPIRSVR